MKIAQLVAPWICVPPKGYGGTELIVYNLVEGLVKKGHEVTLFASGDSKTHAKLHAVFPKALGNSGKLKYQPLNPLLHYIECFERATEFDIIHNHAQYIAMFLADLVKTPVIHTIHGSFSKKDVPEEKRQTLKKFSDHNFVSISNSQRRGEESINYLATIYNGLDPSEFEFSEKAGNYLCWISRIVQKKGPDVAIKVASKLKLKLHMIGPIDPIDKPYYLSTIKPLIDTAPFGLITFKEAISRNNQSALYKNALCTLYPISWEEPFGLVMIESMACGTPVIAYNRGSAAEVVKDGVTGFIIDPDDEDRPGKGTWVIKKQGIDGLVEAIKRIGEIDRKSCRAHVEKYFTVERMVEEYESIYKKVLGLS